MNWKRAEKGALPEDNEIVLVSVNGVYYVTKYLSRVKVFEAVHSDDFFYLATNKNIFWTPIQPVL